MPNHQNIHRRQGAKEFFNSIADAFSGEEVTTKTTPTKAAAKATTTAAPTTTAVRSAVSVVYVTASPTFDGPIGGYKTLGVEDAEEEKTSTTIEKPKEVKTTTTQAPVVVKPTTTAIQEVSSIVAETEVKTTQQTTLQTSTNLPTAISAPTAALTTLAAVVAASGSATRSSTSKKAPTLQSSVASASASSTPTPSPGMSAGGKAGLAIGILLLIGAILAIALFAFKKRKDKAKREEEIESEKSAMFAAAARPASTKTNAAAPQLSLRPVTEFLPNLGAKRSSQGNVLNTMAAATPNRQQTPPEQNRNNPFGNSAEIIDSNNANGPSPVQLNGPSGEVIVAAAGLTPAGGLARGASKRVNGASPMDYTTKNAAFMGPPSPSGTEFSENSELNTTPTPSGTGAAILAAGGPANTAVHRVQLDFKPSMEDELELRAGQLVRVLHEYDDGWALCIRLDRSQQGVAPRTCLSTRPVKPRSQQQQGQGQRMSPPNQGQRGPGPQGQMRANSPPGMNGGPPVNGNRGPPMGQGGRPESPGGRNSPGPQYNAQRPNTPQGQGRPMTPQGQGQGRPMTPQGQGSPSMNQQQGQRTSPQGPSPMNPQPNNSQPMSSSPPSNFGAPVGRKPVPGQAM